MEPICTPNTFYPSGNFWCLCHEKFVDCSLRAPPSGGNSHKLQSIIKTTPKPLPQTRPTPIPTAPPTTNFPLRYDQNNYNAG